MENIVEFSHTLLNCHIKNNDIVIDFTVGNGYDTLFLSKLCSNGIVFGFDIQENAIKNTNTLLKKHKVNNVKLILDSHSNIEKYVKNKINGGIFNLGYLPNGNKNIITTVNTTKIALQKAVSLLKLNGIIVVVCYTGHKGGLKEATEIKKHLTTLDNKTFSVLCYEFINKNNCPFILAVTKTH